MATAKNQTPYQLLVSQTTNSFTPGDTIRPADLPPLTDSQLAVILNEDTEVAYNATRPAELADILNSAVLSSPLERLSALGLMVRAALNFEARAYLCGDINTELYTRWEVATPLIELADVPATEAPWEVHGDSVAYL